MGQFVRGIFYGVSLRPDSGEARLHLRQNDDPGSPFGLLDRWEKECQGLPCPVTTSEYDALGFWVAVDRSHMGSEIMPGVPNMGTTPIDDIPHEYNESLTRVAHAWTQFAAWATINRKPILWIGETEVP